MSYEQEEIIHRRRDLERDLRFLFSELDLAFTTRDAAYSMQSMTNDLVLDDETLSRDRAIGDLKDSTDAMAEYAAEVVDTLNYLWKSAQEMLDNLPDEVACDECGNPLPCGYVSDEDDPKYHAEWCEQGNKED